MLISTSFPMAHGSRSRSEVRTKAGYGSYISLVTDRASIVKRPGLVRVYCSAHRNSLLYSSAIPEADASMLYYTNLRGETHLLWQQKGFFGGAVWASPDGRYLSITGVTTTSNALAALVACPAVESALRTSPHPRRHAHQLLDHARHVDVGNPIILHLPRAC